MENLMDILNNLQYDDDGKRIQSISSEILNNEFIVIVEDWTATIYDEMNNIIVSDLISYNNMGGSDWYVFRFNNKCFKFSTHGQGAFYLERGEFKKLESY